MIIKFLLILGILILYLPRLRPAVVVQVQKSKFDPLFLAAEFSMVVGAALLLYFVPLEETLLTEIGFIIFAIGVVLATVARYQLGPDYAPAAAMRVPEALRISGTYSIVRHPVYLGMFFVVFGFALAVWYPGAVVAIFALIFYIIQIEREEEMLAKHHPEAWAKFTKKVRYRLFPFVY